jgi:hypothetical protein
MNVGLAATNTIAIKMIQQPNNGAQKEVISNSNLTLTVVL